MERCGCVTLDKMASDLRCGRSTGVISGVSRPFHALHTSGVTQPSRCREQHPTCSWFGSGPSAAVNSTGSFSPVRPLARSSGMIWLFDAQQVWSAASMLWNRNRPPMSDRLFIVGDRL